MWEEHTNDIEEVHEFMLMGADLNNLPTNNSARNVEYEKSAFSFKTTTVPVMKDLAMEMGLQYTGTRSFCGIGS